MAWGATAVLEPASPASRRIFISYRREDTEGHVLALVPLLRDRFGEERIFKDTDSIRAGDDFIVALERELVSCTVMLVVIGRNWLTIQDPRLGSRRLDNPADLVRIEVATALESPTMRVFPVLVGGASMPAAEDLPSNLQSLARRQATVLTNTHWVADIETLIGVMEAAGDGPPALRRLARVFRRGVAAVAAVSLIVVAAIWLWGRGTDGRASIQGSPEQPPVGSSQAPSSPDPRTEEVANSKPPLDRGSVSPPGRSTTAPPPEATGSPRSQRADPTRPVDLPARQSSVRDAEAMAARARQRALTAGAKPETLTAAGEKQLEAERLRNAGQTDSAIQLFLVAASEFDVAAEVASKPRDDRDVPPSRVSRPTSPKDESGDRSRAESAVRETLERFRVAYSGKNKGALLAVFPAVQADKLLANLEVCARVSLSFSEMTVRVLSATDALVDVLATYGCQPPTGQQLQLSKPVRDTFRLTHQGTEWIISRRQITLEGG